MKIWHYMDQQDQSQQIPETGLGTLVQSGTISGNTYVWSDGMGEWQLASQVLPQWFSAKTAGSPPPPSASMRLGTVSAQKSHVVDYEIFGEEMQIIEVELDPGEVVIAEAGAMNYMEEGITFEAKMGDGASPAGGLFDALKNVGKRVLTGESIFMTHFTNQSGSGKRRVAFAAPYPGKIIPIDLESMGGELICQKDAFLCAAKGTQVGIAFNKRLGVGFFGGEGFIMQRLTGDGLAFIHAGGTLIRRELKGETLRVDTGCLVAMTAGIQYDIEMAGGLKSMVFGGEGMFLATLKGHGVVYLQSLPFSRMADRILKHAPSAGGSSRGEGSLLGGLGRMIDGS